MGQGDLAKDFDPAESSGNVGILCVFPIFRTARMGQKARQSPQLPLCGVALGAMEEAARVSPWDFAVVAHGGVIELFLQDITGKRYKPRYCEVILLQWENGRFMQLEKSV